MKKFLEFLKSLVATLLFLFLALVLIIIYGLITPEEIPNSYYEISMFPIFDDKKIPNVKRIDFDYYRNIVVELENLENDLYLKKIIVSYKGKNIGEIDIDKSLSIDDLSKVRNIDINEKKFKYSINDDLLRIFGKENEKYNISTGPYMDNGVIFEIVIEDKKNNKIYNLKREISILFVKKGKARQIMWDH